MREKGRKEAELDRNQNRGIKQRRSVDGKTLLSPVQGVVVLQHDMSSPSSAIFGWGERAAIRKNSARARRVFQSGLLSIEVALDASPFPPSLSFVPPIFDPP